MGGAILVGARRIARRTRCEFGPPERVETDRRNDRVGSMSDVSVSAVEGGVELTGQVFLPTKSEFGKVALRVAVPTGSRTAPNSFGYCLPRFAGTLRR